MNDKKTNIDQNLKLPRFDFFENVKANEKAEDVMIDGFIMKLPKLSAELQKKEYQADQPLIDKEALFNKKLKDI